MYDVTDRLNIFTPVLNLNLSSQEESNTDSLIIDSSPSNRENLTTNLNQPLFRENPIVAYFSNNTQ